jgi:hypothetical protein
MPCDDGDKVAWAVLEAPRRNSIQVRKNAHLSQIDAYAQSRSTGVVGGLPSTRWWRSRPTAPMFGPIPSARRLP